MANLTIGEVRLQLQEFLECFPPPQIGRIIDGIPQDIIDQEDLDITNGTLLKFHRKVNPNVTLTFQDSWGASDQYIKLTVPVEFPGKFKLMPYDPVSGDDSQDHIISTVEDLVKVFPVFVQANVSYGDKQSNPNSSFQCGDRFKLIRLIYRNDIKHLECRAIKESRLISLPMNCMGNFTVVPTNNEYLLADIVSMPPRKRRVRLCDSGPKSVRVPGLPSGFKGDLFVDEPSYFVEASPLNDPGLIIGLPHNLEMTVAPDEASNEKGFLLNSFATNNRNIFPVVARIVDWDEETTILENHFIKPGVELVIHGWTRQSKVLARTENHCFAIPLTYQGQFKLKPQEFKGVSDLEHAHPAYKLKVTEVDSREGNIPLSRGDVIRVKRGDSMKKTKDGEIKYLKCEKYSTRGTTRVKEIKLPMSASITFEEISDNSREQEFHIKELVTFLSDHEMSVELLQPSSDQRILERDLPVGEKLTLCEFIVEPAIYVSVEAVDAPAFHIPLRTQCYVTFVEQLEKSSSPLLTKQNPRLSTLDRCVEILPEDMFYQLARYKADNSSNFPTFTGAHAFNSPSSTSQWNTTSKVTQSQPRILETKRKGSFQENNPPLVRSHFESRKYKSTENVFRSAGLSDGGQMSLPAESREEVSMAMTKDISRSSGALQSGMTQDGIAKVYSTGAYSFSQQSQTLEKELSVRSNGETLEHSQRVVLNQAPMTVNSSPTIATQETSTPSPPVVPQLPPGYVLMPTAQAQAIPAGYSLVPVFNHSVAGSVAGSVRGYAGSVFGDEEDDVDDLASDISRFTFSKGPSFKVAIPPDGNLYHFSVKKFAELLRLLKIEEPYIRACLKEKIDGKKFSRMMERDLENFGLMHPIILHFRRNTSKKKASTSKFLL